MTASEQNKPHRGKLSIWLRIQDYILLPELTSKQVAWSFAIGLSIAVNPLLGLHTLIALVSCFIFRKLHRPLLLSATFLNNPWTMVPIATVSVIIGKLLLGRGWAVNLSAISWKSIGLHSFTSSEGFNAMYTMLRPILIPYLLGGFTLSLLAFPAGYGAMLRLSRKLKKTDAEIE